MISFSGNLSRLTNLSAQRNNIVQLPASMSKLRLESLDLFGNPIKEIHSNIMLSSNLGVPTLQEVAARFIKRQRYVRALSNFPLSPQTNRS